MDTLIAQAGSLAQLTAVLSDAQAKVVLHVARTGRVTQMDGFRKASVVALANKEVLSMTVSGGAWTAGFTPRFAAFAR